MLATHVGPDELLRHPGVYAAIVERLEQQAAEAKQQELKQRIRKATGHG